MKEGAMLMPADRFIYSANAVGVGANFAGSNSLVQSWASCALPTIGGKAHSGPDQGPKGHPVLSFDNAETTITGEEKGQKRVTTIKTTVNGLNVCSGKVKADKVELVVTATFDIGTESLDDVRVDPTNPYDNLQIDNNPFGNISLAKVKASDAGKNHRKFRKDNHRNGKGKYHTHWRGKAHTTLANDDARLKFSDFDYAYVDVPGCGRVYFAEWSEEEDWQRVVGLRIKLASPNQGEIVIADPDFNGYFFP
jgi:hypothetical protein